MAGTLEKILSGIGLAGKETKEEKERRFHTALGAFICAFARTEMTMYIYLQQVLKIAGWKTRAMIGGSNMGALVSIAKRIAPKGRFGPKRLKELNLLFTQMEHISNFRNDLVHRGAEVSETEIRSDNFFSAKEHELAEEMVFDIDHVTAASADLDCIRVRLYRVTHRKSVGRLTRAQMKGIYAPWRYKPLVRRKMWNRLLADALGRRNQSAPSPALPLAEQK